MWMLRTLAVLVLISSWSLAKADVISATANIGAYSQSGSVLNTSDPGNNISAVVIDFGTPMVGGATFDSNFGSTLGGGVPSNFLADPRYSQTITFGGLSVAPSATFNFGGLDMDVILSLIPLIVDGGGGSVANASISVTFSSGDTLTAPFQNIDPSGFPPQTIFLTGSTNSAQPVPEPSTLAMLCVSGCACVVSRIRKRKDARHELPA